MKVLPHGSIVWDSQGSPTAFLSTLEQIDDQNFSGYLELRMRIPGAELWGVIIFDAGKLIESYASKMGVDVFGEAAYLYLLELANDEKTVLYLHELDPDNILDFIMLGRGKVIKIEDGSWRPDSSGFQSYDDTVPPTGPALEPPGDLDFAQGEVWLKKVVLLGDPSVGKTSLMRRFIENSFDEAYLSTIGSNVNTKSVRILNGNGSADVVKMMIWDIAGDRACDSLKRAYYRGAHAGIVVCDITIESSFTSLKTWIETLRDIIDKDIPIAIVGNKADLEEFRCVDQADLIELANEFGSTAIETSALSGANVEMVFYNIAKNLVEH